MSRIRHDVAQPLQGTPESHACRVRRRQALHESELPVAVPELDAADYQPPVARSQPLQPLQVAPPGLVVEELLVLRGCLLRKPERLLPRSELPTDRRTPQLVGNPVLNRAPEVDSQGTDLRRPQTLDPGKRPMQDVLDQIAGVYSGPRPPWQAAASPPAEPRRIARIQFAGGGPATLPRASQEKLVRASTGGIRSAGPPGRRRNRFHSNIGNQYSHKAGAEQTARGSGYWSFLKQLWSRSLRNAHEKRADRADGVQINGNSHIFENPKKHTFRRG